MNKKYLFIINRLALFLVLVGSNLVNAQSSAVVARVLGQAITEQQISPSPIQMLLLKQKYQGEQLQKQVDDYKAYYLRSQVNIILFSKFIEDNNITASAKDIENFKKMFFGSKQPKDQTANDQVATEFIIQWYLNKKLYQKYKGAVIYRQTDPFYAFGAIKAFLQDQQKKGAFKITDEKLKQAYWAPYNIELEYVIPANQVNFSKPWWENMQILTQ